MRIFKKIYYAILSEFYIRQKADFMTTNTWYKDWRDNFDYHSTTDTQTLDYLGKQQKYHGIYA